LYFIQHHFLIYAQEVAGELARDCEVLEESRVLEFIPV
jgi:hypothetical protein